MKYLMTVKIKKGIGNELFNEEIKWLNELITKDVEELELLHDDKKLMVEDISFVECY